MKKSTEICQVTGDLGCAEENSTDTFPDSKATAKQQKAKKFNLPTCSSRPQRHGKLAVGGSEAGPPLSLAAVPSFSVLEEASCTSSFLHPHFSKARLNIATIALRSQLREGGSAPLHFRKSGRNQHDLQEHSFSRLLLWFPKSQIPTGWRVLKFSKADDRALREKNMLELTWEPFLPLSCL